MRARFLTRAATVLGAAAATVAGLAVPAAATPEGPGLAAAEVDIAVHADGTATVDTTYRLTAPTEGTAEIPLLVMPRDDAEITELRTTTPDAQVGPVEPGRVTATLPAGTAELTLEHTVRRDADSAAVLLAVPEIATARDAEVAITLTLPDGERPAGDTMPSFTESTGEDGTVTLEHRSGDLPSVVVVGYGERPGPRLGTALSAGGLGALVLLFGLRFAVTRRTGRKDVR